MRATVVGGGGYVGAELVRLLEGHGHVRLHQVVSETFAGRPLASVLPNMRGRLDMLFVRPADIEETDILFAALPPARFMGALRRYEELSPLLVDLSPDFRIPDVTLRGRYYDHAPEPRDAAKFTPGIPERYRTELSTARHVSVPGCMANAALLALLPPATEALVEPDVVVDARTGSSGAGRRPGAAGHHPERKGALRAYALAGHRHEAEITAQTGLRPHMYATAVDAVRGIQTVSRLRLRSGVSFGDLRDAYSKHYAGEPFVRLLPGRRGAYQHAEPKTLLGSNYCDISLEDVPGGRAVVVSALDNLTKGAAGNAVQCMNIMCGLPEHSGLEFAGLYPC
jgi:N-acetyl-gamma-glutamyl-phosphate/LysW-gamma-L-alpha-aminoadipyl-6-phosphate reductase